MAGKGSGKLVVTLPSDKEILLEREFDAPRHLVFEAMTKPEHVRRWWCCMDGFTMTVCEIDFRVGGRWRFAMRGPDGNEIGFRGEYKEISAPERIVNTEIFEPFPDNPALVTVTLVERGGKTYYRSLVLHQSKEDRDMHVSSGMEVGAGLALDRMEEIARSLSSPGAAATHA
ncbi:MAG: SRPBCC family protein [Myxococcales bacterium]|nr:SRPBCC family protein [Myxococcales bacterium]